MADKRTDADEHPIDAQPLRSGELTESEKLDIGLEGSMMTSEPPQVIEPRTAADDMDDDESKDATD